MKMSEMEAKLRLLLQCNMPAVEVAWMAGYETSQWGQDEAENPYSPKEREFFAWQEGWWHGFYEIKPLYS